MPRSMERRAKKGEPRRCARRARAPARHATRNYDTSHTLHTGTGTQITGKALPKFLSSLMHLCSFWFLISDYCVLTGVSSRMRDAHRSTHLATLHHPTAALEAAGQSLGATCSNERAEVFAGFRSTLPSTADCQLAVAISGLPVRCGGGTAVCCCRLRRPWG